MAFVLQSYKDRVLASSIFEKTINDLLCESRYFFAIAIRFPVIPLVPLHSLSEIHHEWDKHTFFMTKMGTMSHYNINNWPWRHSTGNGSTTDTGGGEKGRPCWKYFSSCPLIRTLRQYIQRHGEFPPAYPIKKDHISPTCSLLLFQAESSVE